jgi:hypothetical protein
LGSGGIYEGAAQCDPIGVIAVVEKLSADVLLMVAYSEKIDDKTLFYVNVESTVREPV